MNFTYNIQPLHISALAIKLFIAGFMIHPLLKTKALCLVSNVQLVAICFLLLY